MQNGDKDFLSFVSEKKETNPISTRFQHTTLDLIHKFYGTISSYFRSLFVRPEMERANEEERKSRSYEPTSSPNIIRFKSNDSDIKQTTLHARLSHSLLRLDEYDEVLIVRRMTKAEPQSIN